MKRRDTGLRGEDLACRFLEKRGYRILQRNYRCGSGEIDIVALQGDCLVFVEVRARTTSGFGAPEESLTNLKQAKLRAAAQHYIDSHDDTPEQWRIDFVAVEMNSLGKPTRIELYESAVGEEEG